MRLSGHYAVKLVRDGNQVRHESFSNTITDEAIVPYMDKLFSYESNLGGFDFQLLVDSDGFSSLGASDTYAGINTTNGWTEFTGYTDIADRAWRPYRATDFPSTYSNVLIQNLDGCEYRITSDATLKGVATIGGDQWDFIRIHGDNTSGKGVIFSIAEFPSDLSVTNGDTLYVKYSLTLTTS